MTQKHQPRAKDFTNQLHPKQKRLEINCFKSLYCLQYCMQIHIFETKQFLSVHWVCVGWGTGVAITVQNAGQKFVMFTLTSCHESCTDAQRELAGPARTTRSGYQARKGLFVCSEMSVLCHTLVTRTPTTWCRSHIHKYSPNQKKKLNIFVKTIPYLLHFMPKRQCTHSLQLFNDTGWMQLIRPPASFVCEPCSRRNLAHCPGAKQSTLLLTAAPCHSWRKGAAPTSQPRRAASAQFTRSTFRRWGTEENTVVTVT